jgi:hypothetical protein
MSYHPVLPTAALAPHPNPATPSAALPASGLDLPRRRQFAQRLAVLIDRIRQATKEGRVDEH